MFWALAGLNNPNNENIGFSWTLYSSSYMEEVGVKFKLSGIKL